jgi:hypothetical protein
VIDAIASEGHFADHIKPIWLALPEEARGTFYVRWPRPDIPNTVVAVAPPSRHPTLVASNGDLKRGRGRRNAMMEHGCGQSFGGDPRSARSGSYAGGEGRDAELFMHPGHHPAARDRARYPAARVEVVGCAKLDSLPRRDRDGPPVVAVSFHWNCTICPETRPAFDGFRRQVAALATSFEVIGHGHPRIIRRLAAAYRSMGIETVGSFAEVCARADVYVNDGSSTLFEFASTGRPVVVLNSRLYRRKVDHGLRFWEASTVGVNVEEGDDLTEAVTHALEDPPDQRAERERCVDLVYAYRSGAAGRAAAALMDWAGVGALAVA